ncbi:hypothetical protein HanXRQr2_Chr17g0819611 [Helianthus annuus]|uniref:Uncharacterized protein n=1 Tax=Helianthus annuus TaxID=4232 RepID=A0A251RS90_HELAN|nr:hypothetical protein HanXRQr2_Chr17g0819611 [Helianthus annuus]KAJ0430290.1 hypothetical protein HanHA300_Chr17g0667311 [Helianthus annuus]KAJ0435124.1 hypothetical protein HanIR_Chr17g0889801 [Helianthus annuus]KAJ0633593.1 hypothetical protein HanLR1_Chr17g0678631 [Helianthus annuus]
MLTETVTYRFPADNLNCFSDDFDIHEIEESVKVVEHTWDDAFVAGYEDLTSDVVEVRETSIKEIAKMSFWFIDLDLLPPQSTVC